MESFSSAVDSTSWPVAPALKAGDNAETKPLQKIN